MGEHAGTVDDMAAPLAAVLQVQGNKGRSEWSKLHGKLAEVAAGAGSDDPTKAVQALLDVAKDASSSQALMRALEERVSKANLKNLVSLVAHELAMTPLGDSEPVHMIDEDSNFCKENVDRLVKCSAELSAPDAPYAVVSIVGAQSSGKSFLLNHLFGTRFPEMNAQRRRCQTTRGIMMSRCIGPSLILLDVEGFDGREKGQDKLFENQAALFALNVSDLMMVNMLVTDIGREKGGATSLFRTIFQERIKLQLGITKLMVVLRRFDIETPLELMRIDVMESLEKIWESVNMESVKFKDYIEVDIVGLQDKSSPEFPKEVTVLRNLLSNNLSAKVPASSFSLSSSMLWDTIKENKNLDIPSQQMAIASLYCRQLVDDTLNSLNSKEEYKLLKTEESPRRFNEISYELLGKLKNEYDLETKKYDTHVRDDERRHLVEKLHRKINGIAIELANKLLKDTLEQFIREFSVKNIKDMKEARDGLYKYAEQFVSSCEDLKVYDSDELSKIRRNLEERLASFADKLIENRNGIAIKLANKVLEDTVEQFEREFPEKNIKDMKEARDGLYKYVEQFTSSCEDLKVFHSDLLSKMCTDLEERLASFADQKIKEEDERISEQRKKVAGYVWKGITTAGSIALYAMTADVAGVIDGVSSLIDAAHDGENSDISSILREIRHDARPRIFDSDIGGAMDHVSNLVAAAHDGQDSDISSIIHEIGHDLLPHILDDETKVDVSRLIDAAHDGQDSEISSIIREIRRDLLPHNVFDADLAGAWHGHESSLDSAAHDPDGLD